jgi:hypothetical protein
MPSLIGGHRKAPCSSRFQNSARPDPSQARIFRRSARFDRKTKHASEDHAFLQAVAQSIADAGAVLITGLANAKTELVKHIGQHDSRLMRIIVGVETVDHPSDGQLVAHARHYFKAEDRMLPQKD